MDTTESKGWESGKKTFTLQDAIMNNQTKQYFDLARAAGYEVLSSDEGLNPRIHCAENIPEKVLDITEGD